MTLPLVQVLRALAALLVTVHHAQGEGAVVAARIGEGFSPSHLLPWAAGVDVFFVISGFIIVHASAPLYGRRDGRRRFMAHRIARLVPLYWLVSAGYLAVALARPGLLTGGAASGRLDPGYVIASFLFWPAVRADGYPLPLYSLGWTLNCEMFFYVLFALAIGWGRRAAVAWICGALLLFALAGAVRPDLPMPLGFWSAPLVLEFALGALLGLARAEGLRLDGRIRLALAVAGIVLLALAGEADLWMRPLVYGLPAMMLVAAAALGQGEPGPDRWRGLLQFPVALGDASYALYLVHPFALRSVREALLALGLAPLLGPWGGILAMLAGAILAALLVHRLVERPMTRWARALLDPAPAGTASGPCAAAGSAGSPSRRVSSGVERI